MAVTIAAPPEPVWPWLAQMGVDRDGFNSYVGIKNGLRRLSVTNADCNVPVWQNIRVGDRV